MKHKIYSSWILTASIVILLSSCGTKSVTNVWDYYVSNEVVKHNDKATAVSYRKLLYQGIDNETNSQLDLIAVKQDSSVFLVLGSYKMSTPFVINDSMYAFGLNDLYSRTKGDDLVGKTGSLSVFFTQVPVEKCVEFLDSLESIRKQYADAPVMSDATTTIDFYFSTNVFISIEKVKSNATPTKCVLWVGRRKHVMSTKECVNILTQMKNFH